jgi:peptidoglycan hydrolase-like protein with peptidoglycan-binding domain
MAKAAVKAPVSRSVESLRVLLSQINELAPNRSKASDGWIGDMKHMARHSDHNPEPDGTVDARDFTNDPSGGCDARKLAQAILDSKDKRLSYVISNGEIASGRKGPKPWTWRKYTGANGHYHHCHVSVLDEGQDDKTPWKIESAFKSPAKTEVVLTKKQVNSVMHLGSKGDFVKTLQQNLNKLGYPEVEEDGVFGEDTDANVRAFQKDAKLDKVDGWAGPATVAAISSELMKRKVAPKIEAAAQVVNASGGSASLGGFSTTEAVTAVTGVTGTATVVKEGIDSVKDTTSSFMDLVGTVGPWVLLAVVLGCGAAYIFYERRQRRIEATQAQKVI